MLDSIRTVTAVFLLGLVLAWTAGVAPARADKRSEASDGNAAVEKDHDAHHDDANGVAAHHVSTISAKRLAKKWLRDKATRPCDLQKYGLHVEEQGEKVCDPTLPLVVLLHGFNSTPGRCDALLAPIRQSHFETATFCYPNDQPIADSARLLAHDLRELHKQRPKRHIALLAHSMGGLVAREAIENSELDPGNVEQLIMVATPNHGTQLARFAKGADIWEHAIRGEHGPIKRLRASIVDGLAEATEDLQPGSDFLVTLNGRGRNPHVRYTIVLGSDGPLTEHELSAVRRAVRRMGEKSRYLEKYAKECDQSLADMTEVVDGKGDGVVSIERGRLDGVDDVVVLHFSHLAATHAPITDAEKQLHKTIMDRLTKSTEGTVAKMEPHGGM